MNYPFLNKKNVIEGFIYALRFIYTLHFSINFGVYDLSLQAVLAITVYSFRILLLIHDDGWCLTSFCIHNDSTDYIGNIPLGVHVVSFPDTTTKGYIQFWRHWCRFLVLQVQQSWHCDYLHNIYLLDLYWQENAPVSPWLDRPGLFSPWGCGVRKLETTSRTVRLHIV